MDAIWSAAHFALKAESCRTARKCELPELPELPELLELLELEVPTPGHTGRGHQGLSDGLQRRLEAWASKRGKIGPNAGQCRINAGSMPDIHTSCYIVPDRKDSEEEGQGAEGMVSSKHDSGLGLQSCREFPFRAETVFFSRISVPSVPQVRLRPWPASSTAQSTWHDVISSPCLRKLWARTCTTSFSAG